MIQPSAILQVDGWFDAQMEMDSKTNHYSRIYTILFIVVGHFLIFNIFVGVNIMNIQEANENYHEQVGLRGDFFGNAGYDSLF